MSSPSALRNRDAIRDVLLRHLRPGAHVLEIASGTGEHVAHFAAAAPGATFQPSDPETDRRASIDAWCAGLENVRQAIALDVTAPWPGTLEPADLVLCCNMIHIAPWAATLGLLAGARGILRPGGRLMLYGPFQRGGVHTAVSNAAFDEDLKSRNPEWGVRDLDIVAAEAALRGFAMAELVVMPANNLSVMFRQV